MRYSLVVHVEELPLDLVTDAEDAGLDHPLPLQTAVFVPELFGAFSVKQLRSAIEAGVLPASRHGRTLYVTRAGLAEWRTNCLVQSSQHASGSARLAHRAAGSPTARPSGSSSTLASSTALDAALAIARGLKLS